MAWVCSCGQKNLVSGVPCLACDRYAPENTDKSSENDPASRFESPAGTRFREEADGVTDANNHRFRTAPDTEAPGPAPQVPAYSRPSAATPAPQWAPPAAPTPAPEWNAPQPSAPAPAWSPAPEWTAPPTPTPEAFAPAPAPAWAPPQPAPAPQWNAPAPAPAPEWTASPATDTEDVEADYEEVAAVGEWPDVERRVSGDRRVNSDRRDYDRRESRRRPAHGMFQPSYVEEEVAPEPEQPYDTAHEIAYDEDRIDEYTSAAYATAVDVPVDELDIVEDLLPPPATSFATDSAVDTSELEERPSADDLYSNWDELNELSVDNVRLTEPEATMDPLLHDDPEEPDWSLPPLAEEPQDALPWWEKEGASYPSREESSFDWGPSTAEDNTLGANTYSNPEEFAAPDAYADDGQYEEYAQDEYAQEEPEVYEQPYTFTPDSYAAANGFDQAATDGRAEYFEDPQQFDDRYAEPQYENESWGTTDFAQPDNESWGTANFEQEVPQGWANEGFATAEPQGWGGDEYDQQEGWGTTGFVDNEGWATEDLVADNNDGWGTANLATSEATGGWASEELPQAGANDNWGTAGFANENASPWETTGSPEENGWAEDPELAAYAQDNSFVQDTEFAAPAFQDEAGYAQNNARQDNYVDAELQGFGFNNDLYDVAPQEEAPSNDFAFGDDLPYTEEKQGRKSKDAPAQASFATHVDLDAPDDFENPYDDWGFDDEVEDEEPSPKAKQAKTRESSTQRKSQAQKRRTNSKKAPETMDLGTFMRKWGKFLIVIAVLIVVVLLASFGNVFGRVGASGSGSTPNAAACTAESGSTSRPGDLQSSLADQFGWTAKPDYEARTGVIDFSRALQLEPDNANALGILDRTRFVGGYDRTYTSQTSKTATMGAIVYQFAGATCALDYASNRVNTSKSTKDFDVPGIDNAKGITLEADGSKIYQVIAPHDQFVMMISITKSSAQDPIAEINRSAEAQMAILKA